MQKVEAEEESAECDYICDGWPNKGCKVKQK